PIGRQLPRQLLRVHLDEAFAPFDGHAHAGTVVVEGLRFSRQAHELRRMPRGHQLDGEQGAIGSAKNQDLVGGGHRTISRYETRGWERKASDSSVLPSAQDFTRQCRISSYEIRVKVSNNSKRQTREVCLIHSTCGNVAVRQPLRRRILRYGRGRGDSPP